MCSPIQITIAAEKPSKKQKWLKKTFSYLNRQITQVLCVVFFAIGGELATHREQFRQRVQESAFDPWASV
jgi:hypothetical protein